MAGNISIRAWLEVNKLGYVADVFEERDVAIEELMEFTTEELKEFASELKLDALAKRRFLKAIADQKAYPSSSPARAVSDDLMSSAQSASEIAPAAPVAVAAEMGGEGGEGGGEDIDDADIPEAALPDSGSPPSAAVAAPAAPSSEEDPSLAAAAFFGGLAQGPFEIPVGVGGGMLNSSSMMAGSGTGSMMSSSISMMGSGVVSSSMPSSSSISRAPIAAGGEGETQAPQVAMVAGGASALAAPAIAAVGGGGGASAGVVAGSGVRIVVTPEESQCAERLNERSVVCLTLMDDITLALPKSVVDSVTVTADQSSMSPGPSDAVASAAAAPAAPTKPSESTAAAVSSAVSPDGMDEFDFDIPEMGEPLLSDPAATEVAAPAVAAAAAAVSADEDDEPTHEDIKDSEGGAEPAMEEASDKPADEAEEEVKDELVSSLGSPLGLSEGSDGLLAKTVAEFKVNTKDKFEELFSKMDQRTVELKEEVGELKQKKSEMLKRQLDALLVYQERLAEGLKKYEEIMKNAAAIPAEERKYNVLGMTQAVLSSFDASAAGMGSSGQALVMCTIPRIEFAIGMESVTKLKSSISINDCDEPIAPSNLILESITETTVTVSWHLTELLDTLKNLRKNGGKYGPNDITQLQFALAELPDSELTKKKKKKSSKKSSKKKKRKRKKYDSSSDSDSSSSEDSSSEDDSSSDSSSSSSDSDSSSSDSDDSSSERRRKKKKKRKRKQKKREAREKRRMKKKRESDGILMRAGLLKKGGDEEKKMDEDHELDGDSTSIDAVLMRNSDIRFKTVETLSFTNGKRGMKLLSEIVMMDDDHNMDDRKSKKKKSKKKKRKKQSKRDSILWNKAKKSAGFCAFKLKRGLREGTAYLLKICVKNGKGKWSEYSNTIKLETSTNEFQSKILRNYLKPLDSIDDGGSHSSSKSSVIGYDEMSVLLNWLDKEKKTKNPKLKLLYRASKHAFSAYSFHTKCDNKKGRGTITIIHSTLGHVFGGYTALPWQSTSVYGYDPKAWLFKMRDPLQLKYAKKNQWKKWEKHEKKQRKMFGKQWKCPGKFKVSNPTNAVYYNASYGPTFGGGNDIYLCNNCNTTTSSYANCGNSYLAPNNQQFLAGSYNFMVKEYEVFLVLKK